MDNLPWVIKFLDKTHVRKKIHDKRKFRNKWWIDYFLLIGESITVLNKSPLSREKKFRRFGLINKINNIAFLVCAIALTLCTAQAATAQGRDRIVRTTSSQPVNAPQPAPTVVTTGSSRPTLTNDIQVVRGNRNDAAWEPSVTKTSSTAATSVATLAAMGRTAYGSSTSVLLDNAIKARYGIRYVYGTSGPNTYDCSGFVWAAFRDAGIEFTRVSARSLWSQSTPVEGDERFKFGTLVFLNGLGHMGIVADENGFYHASSSKGITYSPFKGYWSNRIVGFRKLNVEPTDTNLGR
jgi:peptidoglycan endopeptidase LytE